MDTIVKKRPKKATGKAQDTSTIQEIPDLQLHGQMRFRNPRANDFPIVVVYHVSDGDRNATYEVTDLNNWHDIPEDVTSGSVTVNDEPIALGGSGNFALNSGRPVTAQYTLVNPVPGTNKRAYWLVIDDTI
ncbi:MAG: hypothetical protein JWQ98_2241 [Chlorobi bacterium]|nr:hypothetical protein [Chlorobiota bacterium]